VELIDRADTARLVRRSADPSDLRRQYIRLTPSGREVLERLSRVHRDELRRFRTQMVDILHELA
jgi:DNA-binding MarR family transcriptional regulator